MAVGNISKSGNTAQQKDGKTPIFTTSELTSLKVIICLIFLALIPVLLYNPSISLGPLDVFRKDFFKTELIVSGAKYNADGLSKAIAAGDMKSIKLYVNSKMDLNELTQSGKSPLCLACETGNVDIVNLLLQGEVNLVRRNSSDGLSPIFCAVKSNNVGVLTRLKEAGIRIDVRSAQNNGISPLHYAATLGSDSIVDFLIKSGVDVNSVDLLGKTPLHYAATQNNPMVVLELINFGASLNAHDNDGNTPLDVAKAQNNEYVVKLLTRAGAT